MKETANCWPHKPTVRHQRIFPGLSTARKDFHLPNQATQVKKSIRRVFLNTRAVTTDTATQQLLTGLIYRESRRVYIKLKKTCPRKSSVLTCVAQMRKIQLRLVQLTLGFSRPSRIVLRISLQPKKHTAQITHQTWTQFKLHQLSWKLLSLGQKGGKSTSVLTIQSAILLLLVLQATRELLLRSCSVRNNKITISWYKVATLEVKLWQACHYHLAVQDLQEAKVISQRWYSTEQLDATRVMLPQIL